MKTLCSWLVTVLVWSAALVVTTADEGGAVGAIEGRIQFPDRTPYNITSRVTLNHGEYSTYSRADGSFSIYNVGPGIHVLNVLSTTHHFSEFKIQMLEGEMDSPKCLEYPYPGAGKRSVAHPVVVTAFAAYDYFEVRRGFSILSILKNPMVLMMGFSVGLMFLMPRMMEGLEPEEKERLKQQMEAQQDPSKMISSLFGGLSEPEEPKPKQRKIKK